MMAAITAVNSPQAAQAESLNTHINNIIDIIKPALPPSTPTGEVPRLGGNAQGFDDNQSSINTKSVGKKTKKIKEKLRRLKLRSHQSRYCVSKIY